MKMFCSVTGNEEDLTPERLLSHVDGEDGENGSRNLTSALERQLKRISPPKASTTDSDYYKRQARIIAACYGFWKESVTEPCNLQHIYFFPVDVDCIVQQGYRVPVKDKSAVSIIAVGTKKQLDQPALDFLSAFSRSLLCAAPPETRLCDDESY